MEILSRKKARGMGLPNYFTGALCKNGHVDSRRVDNGACLSCSAEASLRYAKAKSVKRKQARALDDLAATPEWCRDMVVSQDAASCLGLTHFFTGKPCCRGHLAPRFVSNGTCLVCHRINYKSFLSANPGKAAEYARQYRYRHPEKVMVWSIKYRALNRDRRNQQRREWNMRNAERAAEYRRKYNRDNRHKLSALGAARRAAVLQRTPPWADRIKIEAIYRERDRLSRLTGVPHHVDHVVPLRGKTVWGLHVAENLHPIPARENNQKYNRFSPDEDA